MSYIKATILIFFTMSLTAAIGWMIAGYHGVVFSVIGMMLLHFFILWKADQILINLHGAREIHESDPSPLLRALLNDCRMLARRAGIVPPRVYVAESSQPNAFAAGRDTSHASLVFTSGLFNVLNRAEARAVIAHELAHIRRGDALPMGIVAALGGLFARLFWCLALPFGKAKAERAARVGAGFISRLSSSRTREYGADREGGRICGAPMQLAAALEKIQRGVTAMINPFAERNPSIAHLYVIDPLQQASPHYSTHPSTASRIAKLHKQANNGKKPAT